MFNPSDRGRGRLPMHLVVSHLLSEARARGALPVGCKFEIHIRHFEGCLFPEGPCSCTPEFWAVFRSLEVSRG